MFVRIPNLLIGIIWKIMTLPLYLPSLFRSIYLSIFLSLYLYLPFYLSNFSLTLRLGMVKLIQEFATYPLHQPGTLSHFFDKQNKYAKLLLPSRRHIPHSLLVCHICRIFLHLKNVLILFLYPKGEVNLKRNMHEGSS